jgi:outer membrane protein insertion porin family
MLLPLISPQPDLRKDDKTVDLLLVVDPGNVLMFANINVVGN